MPAFAELKKVVDRIEQICFASYGNEIGAAKYLPEAYARNAKSIHMGQGAYVSKNEDVLRSAKRLQEQFIESERARGVAECQERLAALAVEIEMLRAALPSLAAAAAVEVGSVARAAINDAKDEV